MRYPLTVTAPAAGPVTLRVYAEDNSTAARTYADEILEDDLTQPMTIAAGESLTIYVGYGPYWVSALIGGVEMASGEGVRKRVDEGRNALTPDAPPWRAATSATDVIEATTNTVSGVTTTNSLVVVGDASIGDDLTITGNLQVANSAAATTPGTCAYKIEVFDEAGVSLGFLAVYDAIT